MRVREMIVALALALLVAAPSAYAEQVLETTSQPTLVNGYGGRLVWSSYVARGRYALMTYADGVASRVPVRTRRVPFDADVGPGPGGGLSVVYSRCRREPYDYRYGLKSQTMPLYFTGRGCRLFRYGLGGGGGGERRVPGTHARGTSEYLPSIWRSRVAFARVDSRRRRRLARYKPDLYLKRLGGDASVRLRGGPRGDYIDAFVPADVGGPGPIALDLRGRRLAYAWAYVPGLPERRCPMAGSFGLRDGQMGFQMRVEQPGRRAVLAAKICGWGGYDALVSPVLGATQLTYLLVSQRRGPVWSSQVNRLDLATGARTATPPGRELTSIALDGEHAYASRFTEAHAFETELVDVGTLPFE